MECTSLYRTGAVTLVARELAKYRLDLVGVQEVRLDENGISSIGDYMLYYGKGNNNHQLGTGFFVHNRIKSAVVVLAIVILTVANRQGKQRKHCLPYLLYLHLLHLFYV